jgi:hypothetical protein
MPATLSISANDERRAYGDANPALTYVATGFKLNDNAAGVLSGTPATPASVTSNVGTYPIAQGSLAANANYTVSFRNASLSVTPRPFRVAAAPASKVAGTPDPLLRYSADALVNGDVLTGSLARTGGEDAGLYGISEGSLTAGSNYAMHFTANTLTVTPVFYVAMPSGVAGMGNAVGAEQLGAMLAFGEAGGPVDLSGRATPTDPSGSVGGGIGEFGGPSGRQASEPGSTGATAPRLLPRCTYRIGQR